MRAPAFSSGNCFMTETLNRPEIEFLGPLLVERLKVQEQIVRPRAASTSDEVEDARQEIRMLEKILSKIDYPFRSYP